MKKKTKASGMSKDHMKEYAKYSPEQLKKHMGEEKKLVAKKMAKKKCIKKGCD